jgi:parallel beta-helix repeat protein
MKCSHVLRKLIVPIAVAALTFSVAVPALADPPTLTPELAEPPVDLSTVVVLQTGLPALGETLAEPLAVTDAELAGAGSTDEVVPLQLGTSISFVVDDDLAQCPDADFTTATGIQQAIGVAPAGSRIRVCAGTYTPINVNKTLIIEHPVQHGQATQCQAALAPDPTKDAIIDAGGTNVIAVQLAANDIVFYGFHVQNTDQNPGMFSSSLFSGYEILFNVVQRNSFGLYLNASGVNETLVRHNCFRSNNRVPAAAGGSGIYSDQGLRNAKIQENAFTGQPSASMIYTLNVQNIVVEHNDAFNDAGTIVLVNTQDSLVQHNHIHNTTSSGIFVGGGVTNTAIRYNRIIDIGGTGITTNVQFTFPPVPNTGLRIEKNHVSGSPFDGIRLNQTDSSLVSGNKSERNLRDGIRLQNDSDSNTVSNNLSRDNGRDGLRVDGPVIFPPSPQSDLNQIEQNKMLGNVEHDCHDDTAGAGTAGTANFWINDLGKTENRAGLCKNATVP